MLNAENVDNATLVKIGNMGPESRIRFEIHAGMRWLYTAREGSRWPNGDGWAKWEGCGLLKANRYQRLFCGACRGPVLCNVIFRTTRRASLYPLSQPLPAR